MLGASNARLREHVVPEAIDRMLMEHNAGRRNHGQELWALLTLEVFLRRQDW
jgi:hypothetical protein